MSGSGLTPRDLAQKRHPSPGTLQWEYRGSYDGPWGEGALSYERCTQVFDWYLNGESEVVCVRERYTADSSDTMHE